MPELPEVETVRRGLLHLLTVPLRISRVELRCPQLRNPLPPSLATSLEGQMLSDIQRRAKYLLWRCEGGILLNHLGMTGSWRAGDGSPLGIHDHVVLHFADGSTLIYRDPRRFGDLRWFPQGSVIGPLSSLGPEPLDAQTCSGEGLFTASRGSRSPIKAWIMDQRRLVGVGNIYAQESLFRAGIHPRRAAGRIARRRYDSLISAIRSVLEEAIAAGGSTISDFRQAGGSHGYFQHRFQVYGRGDQPCARCGAKLHADVIGGRSTVWCGRCQR